MKIELVLYISICVILSLMIFRGLFKTQCKLPFVRTGWIIVIAVILYGLITPLVYIVDEDLLQKYRPAEEPAEDTQVEEEEQNEAPVIDEIIYKGSLNTKWQQHNVFTRYKIKLVDGRAQICNNSYKAVKPRKLEAADCYAVKIYGSLEYLDYIIAEHFIPHSLEFNVLEHIDGNKQNNNIMNLRWVKQK